MITIPIALTSHAIIRFRERVAPMLNFGAARSLLAFLLERADLYKVSRAGVFFWRLPIHGSLVLARPADDGNHHVAITVYEAAAPTAEEHVAPHRVRPRETKEERMGREMRRRRRVSRAEQHRHMRRMRAA